MSVTAKVEINQRVLAGLKKLPDATIYKIARKTLDLSQTLIPKSNIVNHAGTLRRETMNQGVRGSNSDYYLTSNTNYASRVWMMPESTNWTTPGTNNKWFDRTLKKHKAVIEHDSINQAWKDNM